MNSTHPVTVTTLISLICLACCLLAHTPPAHAGVAEGAVSWIAADSGDAQGKWQPVNGEGESWVLEDATRVEIELESQPGITSAWRFDGTAHGTCPSFTGGSTTHSLLSSFEIWFRPSRLSGFEPNGNATVFETGSAQQGLSLVLVGSESQPQLVFSAVGKFGRNEASYKHTLATDIVQRFTQAVLVIDHPGREVRCYIDGRPVSVNKIGDQGMPNWASDGGAGLARGNGQTGAAKAAGGGGQFAGEIAIVRHYPDVALTDEQVYENYLAVAASGEAASLDVDTHALVGISEKTADDATADAAPFQSPAAHFSWRSTMGTHYRLDADSWLGTVRGWPHRHSTAYHNDYTDFNTEGLEPTVGRFSGETRYYNFKGGDRTEVLQARRAKGDQVIEDAADDSYDASQYETKQVKSVVPDGEQYLREAMAQGIDIIETVLGNVKPSRPEFKVFNDNNGLYFKDVVYQSVLHYHTGEFADKPMTMYFQLGNEVNAYNRFHMAEDAAAEALDASTQKILPNGNPDNARDYVEYYLAPAVEAIRAASQDAYGDPRRVKVVCGSVSGIRSERSQAFLDVLLTTAVKGERAPTLAGKQAWELIDVITIHYAHGDHEILQPLYDKWVATDRVDGLWITEELGARGAGAFCVAQVAARYLDFWASHADQWSPDAARVTMWGDATRNHPRAFGKGSESLELIGPFLRDYPLHQAKDECRVVTNADVEWYMLRADDSAQGQARYFGYFASYTGARSRLRQVILYGPDGQGLDGVVSASATIIDADAGISELPVEVTMRGQDAVITFNYEVPLSAAVIMKVVTQPAEPG